MVNKVDFFKASKTMSERVASFMRVKVWNITLKARLEKAIKESEQRIDTLMGLSKETGRDYADAIADIEALVVKAKEDYKSAVEEGEKFEYTENDKNFYTKYADGKSDTTEAIIGWFKEYGLDVDANTNIVLDIEAAIAGSRKLGARAVVRANAEKFTDDVRTKGDVMTLFYGKLAEAMMSAGTLKAEAIPEDVRDFYAPRKNGKKSK